MRVLLIDNYDSFTYNLVHLLDRVCGRTPEVLRNDDLAGLRAIDPARLDAVVVSPGPGTPYRERDVGLSRWAVSQRRLPLLGICLGHQSLCLANGATVVRAPKPVHGRLSDITHDGDPLFDGIPSPFRAVRYHSLVVEALPPDIRPLARTRDGVLMAARHRHQPQWGVQFHPESIATAVGERLVANFRDLAFRGHHPAGPVTRPVGAVAAVPAGQVTQIAGSTARVPGPATPRYEVRSRIVPGGVPDPEAAFAALFGGDRCPYWLDSSRVVPARFSVMGGAGGPLAEIVSYDVTDREVTVARADGTVTARHRTTIFEYLEQNLRERAVADTGLPCGFSLGYVGYLGYELKADCGGVAAHRATVPVAESATVPDARLVFSDRALVVDHGDGRAWLLALGRPGEPDDGWLDEALGTLAALPRTLRAGTPAGPVRDLDLGRPLDLDPPPNLGRPPDLGRPLDDPDLGAAPVAVSARHGAAGYGTLIRRCQEKIAAGESYEICLTDMLTVPGAVDPWSTYRLLRRANPAPYAAYLRYPDFAVLSSSPEQFLRVGVDGSVESSPIKGTSRRGVTPEQDRVLAARLRASEKDRAENLMIVDLVRNDIGRVSQPGSVEVPTLFGIESHGMVHQMVSTVRGRLRSDASAVAAVRAAFPAGSMTGAPKLRTMEILDELEGGARGVYSGALGYFSLNGAVHLSVVIRTMVVGSDTVHIGTGAAITALSDPDTEIEETSLKARALLRVLAAATRSTAVLAEAPG